MFLVKGLILTTGTLVLLAVSRAGSASVASPCRPQGATSADMLTDYQYLAQSTHSLTTRWRQKLGLSAVPSAQVVIVSDTTTCRRALNAYNTALLPDTLYSSQVDVIKYGTTRFIVADSARIDGEWTPHIVFDTAFTVITLTAR